MRTSATGRSKRRRRAGFTLVELLVVVTILGLASAAVVLALPDTRPTLTAEAERFAARVLRAREEAVLTNQAVEVEVDASGYAFRKRTRGEWRPLEEGPFARTAWEEGTRPAINSAEGVRIAFDTIGYAAPTALALTRGDRSVRVEIDAAGEVEVHAAR
jgi:general secretion pathway protein H